jgi:hypothetical protein
VDFTACRVLAMSSNGFPSSNTRLR